MANHAYHFVLDEPHCDFILEMPSDRKMNRLEFFKATEDAKLRGADTRATEIYTTDTCWTFDR
jgi:hypothetical protein